MDLFDSSKLDVRLGEAEDLGRYRWAAQIAHGKDVLDIPHGRKTGSEVFTRAASVKTLEVCAHPVVGRRDPGDAVKADLCDLPFEDDSFDLIVCLGGLRRGEDHEPAIEEFLRVLRADGVVLISAPSTDAHPEGGQSLRDDQSEDFAGYVEGHFSEVATYLQHLCLTSVVSASGGTVDLLDLASVLASEDGQTSARLPDDARTHSLIVASNSQVPFMRDIVTLGDALDLCRWEDQLTATRRLLATAKADEERASAQCREIGAQLIDANQRLAHIPVLEHRLEEAHANAEATVRGMENSLSWRLTAPLRRMRALGRRS